METYIKQFSSLNTAIQKGKPAPHKAILLLSIMDLIASGKIQTPAIHITEELKQRFKQNWRTYVGDGREGNNSLIRTPFTYMDSEPFWSTYDNLLEAEIDRRLFELLRIEENVLFLKNTIICRYLIPEKKYGKFHSWEILSDFVAIKKSDLSVFLYKGSAIPSETKWFWNIESLQTGERIDLIFYYLDLVYPAYIRIDDQARARLFWGKELGLIMCKLRSDEKMYPLLRFKKISENIYELSMLNATQKAYSNPSQDSDQTIAEGDVHYSHITKYERSAKNRAIAISLHGTKCMACGFDFEKTYGKAGQNYIEVHHVTPFYKQKQRQQINPYTDLICVCSNILLT